jgi:hypothetical protein
VGHRRPAAWVLVGALSVLPAAALLSVPPAPAHADVTALPGVVSTAAQNTSTFAVHVPTGVEVRAIDGVVTMPEVVEGGTITFRVNGAVRTTVPSALYQKVRIPVDPPDVIADGTIGLTMTTEGPAQPGASCLPTGGVASMRKVELDYRGAETPPTSVANFFPPSSAGITVVIPEDGDAQMITAGLTAVAALAYRYDDDTPVNLSLTAPTAETATASQRVVALVAGKTGEVTTAVSTTSGIPMLTLTGSGDSLVNAARSLSADTLALSGTDAQGLSQESKPRSTAKTRSLDDLGIDALALTGYGSVTQQVELRQDSFGVPVSTMDLHLEGSHTAFADASGARLDIRANGDLVGSTVLGEEATFAVDVHIPSSKLRSVNDVELSLNAVAPDGSACTPPSIPAAEVDLDTGSSSVTVTHGTGEAQGFQLFPQIFEGTLPIALRAAGGRQASAAVNAATLVAELQRAAGSPLQIQLMAPDAFLADDRSGVIVGALRADSEALDAPLELSSTRLLDRDDSTSEVTSQDPYAALESIDRNNRLVLMLGSWAPGDKAAPRELDRKVLDAVVASGWANLDGDLVIANAANPAFVAASRSLAPHQAVKKEKSYAKWFILVIAVLLLLLAIQVVVAIRRDRRLSRDRGDELDDDGPAYVEDDGLDDAPEGEEAYEVDELGDVDDLEVHEIYEYAPEPEPQPEAGPEAGPEAAALLAPPYDDDDTGEIEAIGEQYDELDYDAAAEQAEEAQPPESDEDSPAEHEPAPEVAAVGDPEDDGEDWDGWDDWGDESDEVGSSPTAFAADTEEPDIEQPAAVEPEEPAAVEPEEPARGDEEEPDPETPPPSPPARQPRQPRQPRRRNPRR